MTTAVTLDAARRVADTVLYEGYLLYPYRSTAAKNQSRWQFGVLVPPNTTQQTGDECDAQTECILEADDDATVRVQTRFLHLRTRPRRAGGVWDEADLREVDVVATVRDLCEREHATPIHSPAGTMCADDVEYRLEDVQGVVRVAAERLPGPYGIVRLRVRFENTSEWCDPTATRDEVVRRAMVGVHALIGVDRGAFQSSLEPAQWAHAAVEMCTNVRMFPVLVGDANDALVLSSPIILYDWPEIAPESAGALFDATEIDEILSLRTLALTDAEKAEARETDARAAAIIDRVDTMPPEIWERLHGTIRSLRAVEATSSDVPASMETSTPWWDPGIDQSVSPETDALRIGDVDVRRGSEVVLRPGIRRADAQDMFLAGRVARVEAVLFDVDGARYLAVTLVDDPAAELHAAHGRFLYFAPEEVEPTGRTIAGAS